MAEAKDSKKYSVVGEGTFGIVIKPALPNNSKEFPTNVTKIFKKENNYEKAIRNANIIKGKVKSLKSSAIKYTQKYKIKNLPANIKNNVIKFIYGSNPSIVSRNDNDAYIIRLENLGISIHDIEHNSEKYRMIRTMPYQKICQEIYKCMNVVKSIYDSGYIHGDIRQTNVLFNFDTSELNIIDFDWLMPFDEFKRDYPCYFFCHPPECVAIYGSSAKFKYLKLNIINHMGISSEVGIKNIYDDFYNKYTIYNSDKIASAMYDFFDRYHSKDIISSRNLFGIRDLRNKLFDIAKKYIDSYGLGLSIDALLFKAWYGTDPISSKIGGTTTEEEFNNFNKIRLFILGELAPKMTSSDFNERWDINQAIDALSTKMREVGIEAPIISSDEIAGRIAEGAIAAGGAGAVASTTNISSMESEIVAPKSPQKPEEIADAVSEVIAHIETATNTKGGYRRRRVNKKIRKTMKKNRK
jgi:serine/threonine protein kinase